jgi:hypothetical protein
MPQRTATRRSEGWQGSHLTHRQWDLFGANLPDSVVSAPAWPELPMEARAALTGLMVQLMLQHSAKGLTPTEREAGRDV